MTFIFKTITAMKDYNYKRYWIDSNIIPEMRIDAENTPDALRKYAEAVNNAGAVTISKNALRNKSGMYQDRKNAEPEQIGFVITGATEIYDDERRTWTKQYLDLWAEILTVTRPADMEAA